MAASGSIVAAWHENRACSDDGGATRLHVYCRGENQRRNVIGMTWREISDVA